MSQHYPAIASHGFRWCISKAFWAFETSEGFFQCSQSYHFLPKWITIPLVALGMRLLMEMWLSGLLLCRMITSPPFSFRHHRPFYLHVRRTDCWKRAEGLKLLYIFFIGPWNHRTIPSSLIIIAELCMRFTRRLSGWWDWSLILS